MAVCKGSFPEGIPVPVCLKASLPPPALHTAHPAPQQSLATVLSGDLHGTKQNTAQSQISFTLHMRWQHLGHAKALATSTFPLPSPSIITCRGRSPPRHMAYGEPGASQGHHGSPHHCPPHPGERKTDLCKGQLMRKLFASRSAGSTGEEQGSSQVARLSDDNKLAQPEHATSSNARLLPLFWENKRGTRPFLARSCPA